MSDDIFRLVVAAGVVLASIAFVVQAGIAFALYRVSRKMEDKSSAFIDRVQPVISKLEPTLDKAGPVFEKIGPVIERIGPLLLKVSATIDKVPPVIDKAQAVAGQVGLLVQRVTELAASVNQFAVTTNSLMLEARPHLNQISTDAAAIVHTGHEQVERIGQLLQDAGELARNRMIQIDQAVETTVGQVEHAGDSVKSAVMRPVREVNGFAAAISAAVSTLVRGQRKSSVDAATQDEEMFI